MGVQVGVDGTRGPVDEGGDDQSVGVDLEHPGLAGPGEPGVILQQSHSGRHRRLVGGRHLGGDVRRTEAPQHRDALGGRQGQGVPGDPIGGTVVPGRAQGLAGDGMAALAEQGAELRWVDLAVEAEGGGTRARPVPGRLAPAGEVVLQAEGDLACVVAPGRRRHLGQAQHVSPPPRNVAVGWQHRRVQGCRPLNPSWR